MSPKKSVESTITSASVNEDDDQVPLKKKRKNNFPSKKRRNNDKARNAEDSELAKITERYKSFNYKDVPEIDSFDAFPLSSRTIKGLREANFTKPTDIQRLTLGYSIVGKDVVGAAKTGSGKTLALLIPLLECLWRNRWTKFDGLGALIITPTRELAFQIFQVLNEIGIHHEFSVAFLIGGTDVEFEKPRLANMNIVICTPGRLLQHMDENEHFSCENLQILIIDEADRILDMGFRQQMDAIIENLPKDRQTLLFSATQTRKLEDLIRVSIPDPIFVSAHESSTVATPDQLMQSYFVCKEEEKINMLWSFLKNHTRKKTLIFVTCCKQARFLTEALAHLRPGLYFTGLWGDLKQNKRMEHFQTFDANTKGAAMICTDVASRGLDFNGLDWVLQFDCPASVDDYIHRVGRTARMNNKGEAMLMLTPNQEEPFIEMLRSRNVPITKVEIETNKVLDIRLKLANLMIPFPQLKQFAQKSFVAYARAIYFMKQKNVFDVNSIDFEELARSYGLPFMPRIRFLRKLGIDIAPTGPKMTQTVTEEVILGTECDKADGLNANEEDGEDFLKLARKDVFREIKETDAKEEILARISAKKPVSKTEVAKKMIRRLGVVSKRKHFDEDD